MAARHVFRGPAYKLLATSFLALVALTIGVQIARGGGQTRTEVALINILQFVLSSAASLLIANATIGKEYHDKQKELGLSAFRRIREIELSLDRLSWYISRKMESRCGSDCGELETIGQSVLSLKAATNLVLRDWTPIVGDQLEKIERMGELEKQRASLLSESHGEPLQNSGNRLIRARHAIRKVDSELASLEGDVPMSLRVQEDANVMRERYLGTAELDLRIELENFGIITLHGIWHPNESFDRSPADLSEGESLHVSVGDAGARIGSLIVYDKGSRTIGTIANSLGVPMPYRDFVEVVTLLVGSSQFNVALGKVESVEDTKGRTHFTVRWSGKQWAKMAARA